MQARFALAQAPVAVLLVEFRKEEDRPLQRQ